MSLRCIALLAVAAWTWTAPTPAKACSYLPGFEGSIPAANCSFPANGRVLLLGVIESQGGLIASADGEPLDIITDGGPLEVEDPPVGSVLRIEGDVCDESYGFDCEVSLAFEVVEPDTTPPPAPLAISFDVFQFVSDGCPGNIGGCIYEHDLRYEVTVQLPAVDEPLFLHVENVPATLMWPHAVSLVTAGDVVVGEDFMTWGSEVAGDPLSAGCFRATLEDIAGNMSETIETCAPCRARIEAADAVPECFKGTPEWTEADLVADASCIPPPLQDVDNELPAQCAPLPDDDPGATSGAGDGDDGTRRSGCAFAPPNASMPTVLAIVLFLRRRRERGDR